MFDKVNILSLASKFQFYQGNGFNDFADCLSFKFSVLLLLLSSMVIILKQYFMKPISCFMTTDIGGKNLIEYIENYCWVEGTIPITYTGQFPHNEDEWNKMQSEKILYYQWVPFILFAQAIFFYLPQLIWRLFNRKMSGMDLNHLMTKANHASDLDDDARAKEVIQLAHALERLIFHKKESGNKKVSNVRKGLQNITSMCIASKRLGTHLMVLYFIVKLLYLGNSIGQVYIMQAYLKLNTNYTLYGTQILHDIINGRDWENTLVFSRVAYCVAKIRHLGGMNFAVAQCVLPVNMLNEKLYIFFWFWMVLVATATAISIVVWMIRLMMEKKKTAFIQKYLILNDDYKAGERSNKRIRIFEEQFLQKDGIFILQMLASNAGDIITAEIIGQLWSIFKLKYESRLKRKESIYPTENQILKLDSLRIEEKCKRIRPSAPRPLRRQCSVDDIHIKM